jgi:hypothetical protein
MQVKIQFEIKDITFKTEVEVSLEHEEWGTSCVWNEDFEYIEVEDGSKTHIEKWDDMSQKVADIFSEEIKEQVAEIGQTEWNELLNDAYESSLDL